MDFSNGYEEFAERYIALRKQSNVGLSFVKDWVKTLEPRSRILEIGCGDGIPISQAVIDAGHSLFAIDASETMIDAFKSNFPDVLCKHEAVQHSDFFGEDFDCVISIGVMFLLGEYDQLAMIEKVGAGLRPGGQFLFTAPTQVGKWDDLLTGQESISLGQERYTDALASAGLEVAMTRSDEGKNNHYFTVKTGLE